MQTDRDRRVAGLLLAAGAGSRYGGPKALAVDRTGESWLVRAARALEAGGCDPVLVVLGAGGAEAEELLRDSASRFARPDSLVVVHTDRWADGLAASLDAGLAALQESDPAVTAVAMVPVDVPDLDAATVARLIGEIDVAGSSSTAAAGTAQRVWAAASEETVASEETAAPDAPTSPATPEAAAGAVSAETATAFADASARAGAPARAGGVTSQTLRQAHFGGRPGHPVVIGRSHWALLRSGLSGDTGARPYLVTHGVLAVPCDDLGTGADVDTPETA